MCQFEQTIMEYMDAVKDMYKDLVCVARDEESGEIRPMSMVFKINSVTTSNGAQLPSDLDHPQNFTYVIVDPLKWHTIVFQNKWSSNWG